MEEAATTSTWAFVKNSSYVGALFVYLEISQESILILSLLMVVDIITGVIRAGYLHGGKEITSHKLAIGVTKKLLFLTIPFVLALSGKGVGVDMMWLVFWAVKVLILSETYSILSNIYSIHKKVDVQEFDAMSFVLGRLRDILELSIKKK